MPGRCGFTWRWTRTAHFASLRHGCGEKAVCAACIVVRSHDLAGVVDTVGFGVSRAGHVERGVDAVTKQEAVGACSIPERSHDLARGIDPGGLGPVRSGYVERGVAALVE